MSIYFDFPNPWSSFGCLFQSYSSPWPSVRSSLQGYIHVAQTKPIRVFHPLATAIGLGMGPCPKSGQSGIVQLNSGTLV